MDALLTQWNVQYFDGKLSPQVLNILDRLDLSTQNQTVQEILERKFRAMRQTHFAATDFTDDLAKRLFALLTIFSKTWNGNPPPLTFAGRHVKIDTYFTCNPWWQFPQRGTILDLGCGFPPVTTVDLAESWPAWQIIGADPAIPYYIVYDAQNDYATFSKTGDLLYFQGEGERFNQFWEDQDGTKAYFTQLLQALLAKTNGEAQGTTQLDGMRLVTNPITAYERKNLSFQTAAMGAAAVQALDAIRCLGVMVYFDRTFRENILPWFADVLREGGLFICGFNTRASQYSRYTVAQKEQGQLVEREFAFSIDNLRVSSYVVPWWTFHEGEVEMDRQAVLIERIRANVPFRREFDARLDTLLAEHKLFQRDADGYLVSWGEGRPTETDALFVAIHEQLDQEGYVAGAVEILQQAGYDAWRNCVGHISVDPQQMDVTVL